MQIFLIYKFQILQIAICKLCSYALRINGKIGGEIVKHICGGFLEQVTGVFVMQIKGRTIDLCLFSILTNRYILKRFLFKQGKKCLIKPDGSIKIFAFCLVHKHSSSFDIYCSLI